MNTVTVMGASSHVFPSLRGATATKQSTFPLAAAWIASRSLSSGAHSRDPLARNDEQLKHTRLLDNDASVTIEA
jgi:hypothetical protein